jgi:hypothetical protein
MERLLSYQRKRYSIIKLYASKQGYHSSDIHVMSSVVRTIALLTVRGRFLMDRQQQLLLPEHASKPTTAA